VETARECSKFGYNTVVQYEEHPRSDTYLDDLKTIGVEVVTQELKLNPLNVAKLIFHARPDVIHTHFPSGTVLFETAIIAKALGVRKTIAMVHSMRETPNMSPITKYAYNRYDQVIGVSNAVAEQLSYCGVDKDILSTLYLGVFHHVQRSSELREKFRRKFMIDDHDKVFACIAFDTNFKGLDVLLKSFQKIRQDFSNVQLIIIGVNPERSQLPIMARDLGISGRVHWAGILDEGWQVLNAADVYVQSSRFAEGLSLATIEAMALKLPVVATKVAGPGEIVLDGETGFLCTPDDVDSLTSALGEILKQPEQWDRMGKAGYTRYMEILRGEKSVETLVQNYYFT
jgi:glycosyltransferase involved in cell wall biosynthesis